jgi:DNA-directed RNA polymerase beta' subunit
MAHSRGKPEDLVTISRVQFGVLSPAQILEQSCVHVYKHFTRSGEISGTLSDPRLGAGPNNRNAITNLSARDDHGNFGHLQLAMPVYNPLFVRQVTDVMRAVCPNCSSLRQPEGIDAYTLVANVRPKDRLKLLLDHVAKTVNCKQCGSPLPNVVADKSRLFGLALQYKTKTSKSGSASKVSKAKLEVNSVEPSEQSSVTTKPATAVAMTASNAPESKQPVLPDFVHKVLSRITDQDCETLGMNPKTSRPEWMIFTVLPICPPSVRPTVITDDKPADDDLTQSLHNIIKLNNKLTETLQQAQVDEQTMLSDLHTLQWQIAALVNNDTSSYNPVCNRAMRPLVTINKRVSSKVGRVRGNLMGKRVDHSARTVITADPNLSINQVGVPYEVAMIMTFPEPVNARNRAYLRTLVQHGAAVYPGANEILLPGQQYPINLSRLSESDRLNLSLPDGTLVYRHMLDGDLVIFNRQPTLHRMNMMCHRAKILKGRSFRISVNVTEPYGADFDGDEMNMHLLQTHAASTEWESLALASTQIVSPQANKPVIGAVQDTMLAMARLSAPSGYGIGETYYLGYHKFMYLIGYTNRNLAQYPPPAARGWTNYDLFNGMLPPISVSRSGIKIQNGVLQPPPAGKPAVMMNKKSGLLGTSIGSLFHVAYNDLGHLAAADLIDNMSRVASQWLMMDCSSVSLRDMELEPELMAQIEALKHQYLAKTEQLLAGLQNGQYTDEFRYSLDLGPRGLTGDDGQQFEADIVDMLTECTQKAQKIVAENIHKWKNTGRKYDNRFMNMVDSGSKGKPLNMLQIVALLGNQDMGGRRAPNFYQNRPLTFVPKDSLAAADRGFVSSSYRAGLNFIEYVYHAMAGRFGVISTSIKTAETGYIQRKLMKRLETLIISYDGTVREPGGVINQYIYGGDGYNGTKVERQPMRHVGYSLGQLLTTYRLSEQDFTDLMAAVAPTTVKFDEAAERQIAEEEFAQIKADWEYLRHRYRAGLPESIPSVVNFDRLLDTVQDRMGVMGRMPFRTAEEVLLPSMIVAAVRQLEQTLRLPTNPDINRHSLRQFFALLRSRLSSRILLFRYNYNNYSFQELLRQIRHKFYTGLANPGEAVGAIAAQSIGEPGTQLCAIYSTEIFSCINNRIEKVQLGQLIDEIMDQHAESVIDLGQGSSELYVANLYIQSVDPKTEQAKWCQVRAVSRHPANGSLVRVKTRSGREITTTLSHSHLRRDADLGILPVEGSKLKLGDRIPVSLKLPTRDIAEVSHNGTTFKLTPSMGWLLGAYTAEGNITSSSQIEITNISEAYLTNVTKFCEEISCEFRTSQGIRAIVFPASVTGNGKEYRGDYPYTSHFIKGGKALADFVGDSCGRGSFEKHVPEFMFGAELPVISAYIRGAMDGDGNVTGTKNHETVRYCSRSKRLAEEMAILLNYFGIFANILVEQIRGKPMYNTVVLRNHIQRYRDLIGSDQADKQQKLNDAVAHLEGKKTQDYVDCLPCDPPLAAAIASCGRRLNLPNYSPLYGRWQKKSHIGRTTLGKYIEIFKTAALAKPQVDISGPLAIVERAYNSGVLWDEIVELEILPDPQTYVYDLTVPGTESFMIANGIFTHNTLDSFHSTGSKSTVASGVPRFKEILSVTKVKMPSLTIYTKDVRVPKEMLATVHQGLQELQIDTTQLPDDLTTVDLYLRTLASQSEDGAKQAAKLKKELANAYLTNDREGGLMAIRNGLVSLTFRNIVLRSDSYYVRSLDHDPDAERLKAVQATDAELYQPNQYQLTYPIWLMRFQLDRNQINRYLADRLPTLDGGVQFRILPGHDYIRVTMPVNGASMERLQEIEQTLLSTQIKGVAGISKTVISTEAQDIVLDDGSIIAKNSEAYGKLEPISLTAQSYVINTIGSNLREVLAQPYVDQLRTYTNDFMEMNELFGIEVARRAIIRELREVLPESEGSKIDIRHIVLLADAMTCRGFIQKIDRFGAKKGESGPLALASFEETMGNLAQAAITGAVDPMTGVSSNIMLGQMMKLGTNSFGVTLDEGLLIKYATASTANESANILMAEAVPCSMEALTDFEFAF